MTGYFVAADDHYARSLLTPQVGGDMDGWTWDARYSEWFRQWNAGNGRQFCGAVEVYSDGRHIARLCERLGLLHYGGLEYLDRQIEYASAPAAAAACAVVAQTLVDANRGAKSVAGVGANRR